MFRTKGIHKTVSCPYYEAGKLSPEKGFDRLVGEDTQLQGTASFTQPVLNPHLLSTLICFLRKASLILPKREFQESDCLGSSL